MRFEGTLTKWNDERGFGFITPIPAGQDIFVHVSAFARDGQRPQLQEVLSFEITLNKDGKKQAIAVRRDRSPSSAPAARQWRRTDTQGEPRALSSRMVVFTIACALLAAAYWHYDRRQQQAMAFQAEAAAQSLAPPTSAPSATSQPLVSSLLRCDGRQHCSQMTSCSEAKFFLQNCPGVKVDGDDDGVPCEQQWCTHPLAN